MIPIIIPAYEPDDRFIKVLKDLVDAELSPIIVVNDGSGPEYDSIFLEVKRIIKHEGLVLNHDCNRGKGRALKTAFEYVINQYPDAIGVVTADSDGQHTVECIKKVQLELENNPNSLILGVRDFSSENVPWKSRFGNELTEKVFSYVAGVHITDTQTGLRGIPYEFLKELLDVKGERFEFETRMLLVAANRYTIKEVVIETVYDSKENHQTHFNPIKDSIKIYKILGEQFLKFIFSSVSSCLIDIALFALLCHIFRNNDSHFYLILSTVLARVISATYNYIINYVIVFRSKESKAKSAIKYIILACIQMLASAALVTLFCWIFKGLYEVIIKVFVDTFLFFVSYYIQRKIVFKSNGKI